MSATAAHFLTTLNLTIVILIVASLANVALLAMNLSFSRRLSRRRRSLLQHEERRKPDVLGVSMVSRFGNKTFLPPVNDPTESQN
jgi:hypothetical protein